MNTNLDMYERNFFSKIGESVYFYATICLNSNYSPLVTLNNLPGFFGLSICIDDDKSKIADDIIRKVFPDKIGSKGESYKRYELLDGDFYRLSSLREEFIKQFPLTEKFCFEIEDVINGYICYKIIYL